MIRDNFVFSYFITTVHIAFEMEMISQTLPLADSKNTYCNIISVVEFQRWWVIKSKNFVQESRCSKEKNKNLSMNYSVSKSDKIVLSKSIFNVKKNFRSRTSI